jgi:hypothetical protein
MMEISKILAALIAIVSAALILAPAAHADPEHYWAYMNCLQQGGISTSDPNDVSILGFKIYRELRSGTAPDVIYRDLEDQTGMSQSQATSAVSCAQAKGHFLWPGLG